MISVCRVVYVYNVSLFVTSYEPLFVKFGRGFALIVGSVNSRLYFVVVLTIGFLTFLLPLVVYQQCLQLLPQKGILLYPYCQPTTCCVAQLPIGRGRFGFFSFGFIWFSFQSHVLGFIFFRFRYSHITAMQEYPSV